MLERLHEVSPDMIEEWSQTKQAPKHAAWMHDGPYGLAELNE
tara:strand:- start:1226 stop:1351 length:126 start_codon:yes stop_codon:yes gene_type:complete